MQQVTEAINESISTLTEMRQIISPYLPPPVLALIQTIDHHPQISAYIPHEPSITILLSIFTIYTFTTLVKIFSFGGKAIEGLDNDEPEDNVLAFVHNQQQHEQYKESVILFGPCGAGKSLLFHKLTSSSSKEMVQTVMSLKANVMIQNNCRLVDYPGHAILSSKLPSLFLKGKGATSTSTRAIFVVDSTKSLSEAGSVLYSLLTNQDVVEGWNNNTHDEKLNIVIACNKSDISTAKNWRRIKIQLKNEVDKLKKISGSCDNNGGEMDGHGEDGTGKDTGTTSKRQFQMTGKGVDLEDLSKNGISGIKLSFMSLSAKNGDGMKELEAFFTEGKVLADNSSILKSRRWVISGVKVESSPAVDVLFVGSSLFW